MDSLTTTSKLDGHAWTSAYDRDPDDDGCTIDPVYHPRGRPDHTVTPAGVHGNTLAREAETGLLGGTTLGGLVTARTRNAFGEPPSETASFAGGELYAVSYERDAGGRITRKTETVLGTTHVHDYRYDAASRLWEVSTDGALSARYTYDDNSNRIRALRAGVPTLGTVDAQDRLVSWGDQSFTYTPNGELATRSTPSGVTSYAYDSADALTAVGLPTGDQIEYVLDPAGRRVGKKVNGVLEQAFLYQDGLRPIAELDGLGNVVSTFVYATRVNVPDYMVRGGTTYRILTDDLGSVRLVIDVASGTIAQRMEHDEWGRVVADTAPGFQPFGYAGGLHDVDTGLVRFGAREYDPETGRWTSKDPIGFGGGDANLYGYVLGDPVNGIDSSGRATLAYDVSTGSLWVAPDPQWSAADHRYIQPEAFWIVVSSGRGRCQDLPVCEDRPYEGPVPRGAYLLDADELTYDWLFRSGDWGYFREPLEPLGHRARDRTGFFLHGGSRPGSAGCIDVGGGLEGTGEIRRLIQVLERSPGGRSILLVWASQHGRGQHPLDVPLWQ